MPQESIQPRTGAERYFARRRESEEYELAYKHARAEIDEIDRLMQKVEERRTALGWSKAHLAHAAGLKPEAVRRLLTAKVVNPTLRTVVALSSAVGLELDFHEIKRGRSGRQAHC